MTFESIHWKRLILEAVNSIADRDYQVRSWFGPPSGSPSEPYDLVSSPNEEINRLYSDLDFEEFLSGEGPRLRDDQRKAGLQLNDALDNFIRNTPGFLDPVTTIDDPRWDRIRQLAAAFSDKLSLPA